MEMTSEAARPIQSRIQSTERFSPRLASIIIGMHFVALFGAFYFFSYEGLILLLMSHWFFSTFGIALGYHRYLSHMCFVPSKFFGRFLSVVSTLCFQGGPIYWASAHRSHHQKTEMFGDPHSAARGFWWSHMGWLLYLSPNGFSFSKAKKLVPDLLKDDFLKMLDHYAIALNLMVLGASAVLFYAFGRIDLFFWAFPIRIVTVWHATWLTNSFYHGASLIPGRSASGLKNNILGDFILGGEGSHKNHHERPGLYTNSRRWYQIDFASFLIRIFNSIGLIQSVRVR